MPARLAVGAVILRDDGAVLLVQRGSPPREGTWSLPGGKVDPGEDVAAAIVREVLEETGLVVKAGPLVEIVALSGEGYLFEIHEILCTHKEPGTERLRPGDDARDVRWCSREDFAALGVTADVLRVIERASRIR
jgi:8-oxo-dGTP diphosphatase